MDNLQVDFGGIYQRPRKYYERMRAIIESLDGWPFRSDQLTFTTAHICICGRPFAIVQIDQRYTLSTCSAVLMGTAEGGPEAHRIEPNPELEFGIISTTEH